MSNAIISADYPPKAGKLVKVYVVDLDSQSAQLFPVSTTGRFMGNNWVIDSKGLPTGRWEVKSWAFLESNTPNYSQETL